MKTARHDAIRGTRVTAPPFPPTLLLEPISRNPVVLPSETIQTVLAGDTPVTLPFYDVIRLPSGDTVAELGTARWLNRLARCGVRVFRPAVAAPPTTGADEACALEELGAMRRAHAVDAAALIVPRALWGSVALEARRRWGWRIVYEPTTAAADAPAPSLGSPSHAEPLLTAADVVLAGHGGGVVSFPDRGGGPRVAPTPCAPEPWRWRATDRAIRSSFSRASIIVVTFDNLVFTRLCLESLLGNTRYPNYEVIVVDNGSRDGTPAYLRDVARRHAHVRVLFNKENVGFAAANNQALQRATGDVLVLLNNDTIVPPGWLIRLARHLEDPAIGMVGPVTNRSGRESEIDAPYRTYGEMIEFARERAVAQEGERFNVQTVTMFCAAMRRDAYERVGSLDEQFAVGTFEDDDYSVRLQRAGYRLACADDVFVHHFDKASFGKLVPTGEYGDLLRANQRRFEDKWGAPWRGGSRRIGAGYERMRERIREVVYAAVPAGATVLVISRGDDDLVALEGRRGWHFPRTNGGAYAGHYPADSLAAIGMLEAERARGADFLLIPQTAAWWLDHYSEFRDHLERRYQVIAGGQRDCVVVALCAQEERARAELSSEAQAQEAAVSVAALDPSRSTTDVLPADNR
jgi:GT2 family glycosyltransferase